MCPAQPQRGPAALRASRTKRRPGCQCTALRHRPAAATRTEPRGSKSPRHSSARRRAREGSLNGRRGVPTRCAPAPLPPGRNVTGASREQKASRRAPAWAGLSSEAAVTATGGAAAARGAPQHPADPPAPPALPHGRPRLPQPRGGRAARGTRNGAPPAPQRTGRANRKGPAEGGGPGPAAPLTAQSARLRPPRSAPLPQRPPAAGRNAGSLARRRGRANGRNNCAYERKAPRAALRNGPPGAAALPARRTPPSPAAAGLEAPARSSAQPRGHELIPPSGAAGTKETLTPPPPLPINGFRKLSSRIQCIYFFQQLNGVSTSALTHTN